MRFGRRAIVLFEECGGLGWPRRRRAGRCANEAHDVFREYGRSTPRRNIMKGFVKDIESIAVKNEEFRRVLYTAKHCQLVVMALKLKEEIGAEVHTLDQFFRVEEGTGEAVLDGVRTAIQAGFAVLVPAGTNHNIINTGSVPLKLYTIYSPPNHRDGVVHHTRRDAEADNEHFDGKTTE
jgi:mannose-6-phosphate isomerase-like protein (cupin superfamily)